MKDLLWVCGDLRRWVNWKVVDRDGKKTKPPINPRTGGFAMNNNESTWGTYQEAKFRSGNLGIMFGLEKQYGGYYICGLDLDGCLHHDKLEPEAKEVVDKFRRYTEVSPSGNGVHVLFKANKEDVAKLRRECNIEHWKTFSAAEKHEMALHISNGYFTVTGEPFNNYDMIDIIDYETLLWFVRVAGPQFLARYGVKTKDRDESGSGAGLRYLQTKYIEGKSQEEAYAAIKKNRGPGGEWARRVDERQLDRAWDKAIEFGENVKTKKVEALVGRLASTITPRNAKFIWHPYILEGGLCVVAGPGGTGKGLYCADLVARETTKDQFPESKDRGSGRSVYWYEMEDLVDATLVPRLMAAGADLDKITIFQGSERGLASLTREKIERDGVGLIVLSPLMMYLAMDNPNDVTQVYMALEQLNDKVKGLPCTIIGLMHPNKKVDQAAIDRVMGSIAFTTFMRSVILLKPEEDGEVRMVHGKHNNSIKGDDLIFSKFNTKGQHHRGQYVQLTWDKAEDNISVDRAFDRPKEGEKKLKVIDFIKDYLKDGQWHKGLYEACEGHGFSRDATRKAIQRDQRIEFRQESSGVFSHRFNLENLPV